MYKSRPKSLAAVYNVLIIRMLDSGQHYGQKQKERIRETGGDTEVKSMTKVTGIWQSLWLFVSLFLGMLEDNQFLRGN